MAENNVDDDFYDEELEKFSRQMSETARAIDACALFIPHTFSLHPVHVDDVAAMLAPPLRKLLRAVRKRPYSVKQLAEASGRPVAEVDKDVELLVSVGLMRMAEPHDGNASADRLVKKAHGKLVMKTPAPDFDDPANAPFFAAKIPVPASEAAGGTGDSASPPPH
jgi:predicted transcriptional regulator